MDEDFFSKIKQDLLKSGLGSELKAGKIFQENGWSISCGGAYYDKDQGKSREIDIVAHHNASIKHDDKIIIYNSFLIHAEIKKAEKPWIVFKSYPLAPFNSCAWNNIISAINLPTTATKLTFSLMPHSLIKKNGWIGTGIHEAFKNPDTPSRWYGAFLSAIKSSVDYYDSNAPDANKITDDIMKNPTEIQFIQPLVVLDGKLITAELSIDNEMILEEVHSAAFRFEYKTKEYQNSSYRVDVVTMDGLKEYLSLATERQKTFNNALLKEAQLRIREQENR